MDSLPVHEARNIIRACIKDGGSVTTTSHARREMAKDRLEMTDVVAVLRAGIVEPGEWENGAWRYRIRTRKMVVVVELESPMELSVVTAWRVKT